jgi:hypothetical protein
MPTLHFEFGAFSLFEARILRNGNVITSLSLKYCAAVEVYTFTNSEKLKPKIQRRHYLLL